MQGVALALAYPKMPNCQECQAFLYDDVSTGKPTIRRKQKVPRPAGTRPPCATCPKIPKGVEPIPENAIELSDKNRLAWNYAMECAVDNRGLLPQDLITVRNNALVHRATQHHQTQASDLMPLLACLMSDKPARTPNG